MIIILRQSVIRIPDHPLEYHRRFPTAHTNRVSIAPLRVRLGFTPPSLMPDWLGAFACGTPVSSTANAAREMFGNSLPTGRSWIEENALLMAVA